jgi:hypothetical protein
LIAKRDIPKDRAAATGQAPGPVESDPGPGMNAWWRRMVR